MQPHDSAAPVIPEDVIERAAEIVSRRLKAQRLDLARAAFIERMEAALNGGESDG